MTPLHSALTNLTIPGARFGDFAFWDLPQATRGKLAACYFISSISVVQSLRCSFCVKVMPWRA